MERYEHHATITQNKLCPFKLGAFSGNVEDVCNWHVNIEFIMVTSGEGKMRYGTTEISLTEGDVALISSNIMHRLYTDGAFSYNYFIIGERFCIENGIDITEYIFEPKVHDQTLNMLYLAAAECFEKKEREETPMTVLALRSAMLSLIFHVFSNYARPVDKKETGDTSEGYIKRAVTYLNEHYIETVSLDDIASVCRVSKFHLAREFKKHTGQTVFSYVNMLRCKQASLLLSEGKSVTETAYACGYESISYFSRVFANYMGIAPSEFKAE